MKSLDLNMRHCGKGKKGRRQLALLLGLLEQMDRTAFKVDDEWPYVVAKLLVNCEPPDGLEIPHPEGRYRVLRSLHAKGAYALLLKPVSGELLPLVVYRGTRMRLRATGGLWTAIDDLSAHIGAIGFTAILPVLRPFIEDPTLEFVEEGGEHDVIGMSLGGAHAESHAYFFSAFGGLVRRATLICPAGVGQPTIDAFARLKSHPHLLYLTERDDCTPETGDGHIGLGLSRCRIDYYMLEVAVSSEQVISGLPPRPDVSRNFVGALSARRPNILERARKAVAHGKLSAVVEALAAATEGDLATTNGDNNRLTLGVRRRE